MRTDGLFDLQVNGYAGVDFNDPAITSARLDSALEAMLSAGVTGCLPTLITADAVTLEERFGALDAAVSDSRLGPTMVPGYHLEGPFLNAAPGYRGCHPAEAMGDPDAALVMRLDVALARPILLVTLAPERAGAVAAIRRLRGAGKALAMAHSAAGFADVRHAADAGLTASTHLGNGLPQTLPKLENALLAQLAEPRLTGCLIADGHHLSPEALRALVSIKGAERCVLVTDAVLAAAAEPGIYRFAGMRVRLDADGSVRVPGADSLAGSALRLDQAVRNVCEWSVAGPGDAVAMASVRARALVGPALAHHRIELGAGELAWNDSLEPELRASGTVRTPR